MIASLAALLVGVLVIPSASGETEVADRLEHHRAQLIVSGWEVTWLHSVWLHDSDNEVIETAVVKPNGTTQIEKRPGKMSYGPLVLVKPIDDSNPTNQNLFERWRTLVEKNRMPSARRNGNIRLFDNTMTHYATYCFTRAWPSDFDAASGWTSAGGAGGEGLDGFITPAWPERGIWEVLVLQVESFHRCD